VIGNQPEKVLPELLRHLKPGGCLLIGLIAGRSTWSEYYEEAVRNKPTSVFAHAALYSKEEISCPYQGNTLIKLR
jgi:SAM-dependent methyltransferase